MMYEPPFSSIFETFEKDKNFFLDFYSIPALGLLWLDLSPIKEEFFT